MNIKYVKNIEGKFGLYMNGGLVKGEYVATTFNDLVYKCKQLEQELARTKEENERQKEALKVASEAIRFEKDWHRSKTCEEAEQQIKQIIEGKE